MKYKWSPLQIAALVFIVLAVYNAISIARMEGEPGLGGLMPLVYAGFAFIAVVVDFILQLLLQKFRKGFYITEGLIILAFIIWTISIGEI